MSNIPLTRLQNEIMKEFYSKEPTKVIFNKSERNQLWLKSRDRSSDLHLDELAKVCPALAHQIQRSYKSGRNIQPAVFSECVYAQTIAKMFKLDLFVNCFENSTFLPNGVKDLLASYNLSPRYVYATPDKNRLLIQAGGCDGIDSALITVIDLVIYTIEFKEPGAKTSEPDLPKYGEDGVLVINEDWLSKNNQFSEMIKEQFGLNFFNNMGHNINNFSKESIIYAVSNNYTNKLLNVICTEDIDGYLVMMPANQVQLWALTEGEIRPAGRNKYKVWTPKALHNFLLKKDAKFCGNKIIICRRELELRKARGSGKASGYKINPLFFVYTKDCVEENGNVIFDIEDIWQLNPTIAGKVFFKTLKYEDVKKYYSV